jgi:hypothetical protein
MRLAVLLAFVVVLAGCSDPSAPPPDARPDLFGETCVPPGFAPIDTCETAAAEIGWCVVEPGATSGSCRRACIGGTCPDGQLATSFYDATHCYCRPVDPGSGEPPT